MHLVRRLRAHPVKDLDLPSRLRSVSKLNLSVLDMSSRLRSVNKLNIMVPVHLNLRLDQLDLVRRLRAHSGKDVVASKIKDQDTRHLHLEARRHLRSE